MALTAVPPHWLAFIVVPHLFVETISLDFFLFFFCFSSLLPRCPLIVQDHAKSNSQQLLQAEPRRQAA